MMHYSEEKIDKVVILSSSVAGLWERIKICTAYCIVQTMLIVVQISLVFVHRFLLLQADPFPLYLFFETGI